MSNTHLRNKLVVLQAEWTSRLTTIDEWTSDDWLSRPNGNDMNATYFESRTIMTTNPYDFE